MGTDDKDIKYSADHPEEDVLNHLNATATSGTVTISWTELQQVITARFEKVLEIYNERKKDCKDEEFQEPNVEKFDMESSRAEILNLITSFTEPPFTIQRICELLCAPFDYYDKVSTFLRGLEKNLRVVSSYDL